jgi:hypothetical protein
MYAGTVTCIIPFFGVRSGHILYLTVLQLTYTDAIDEAPNQEHGNMGGTALDRSRNDTDGSDDLNGPAPTEPVQDPVDNESTDHASAREQAIGSWISLSDVLQHQWELLPQDLPPIMSFPRWALGPIKERSKYFQNAGRPKTEPIILLL